MLLKVDTSNSIPVYSQIVNQIKHAIASGVLRSGEFLPSLRDTARDLRINPHTVAKAYRELEILGLVRTDHGRGTCVTAEGLQLTKERRHEQLRRLSEQLIVEGYHLGATPEEIIEAVGEGLTELLPEFESRDTARKEENHE